jgi:hypothetical protein
MPITPYDTLGSDSDGDKYPGKRKNSSPPLHLHHHHQQQLLHQQDQLASAAGRLLSSSNANSANVGNPLSMQQQHEMITFRQKQRSGR